MYWKYAKIIKFSNILQSRKNISLATSYYYSNLFINWNKMTFEKPDVSPSLKVKLVICDVITFDVFELEGPTWRRFVIKENCRSSKFNIFDLVWQTFTFAINTHQTFHQTYLSNVPTYNYYTYNKNQKIIQLFICQHVMRKPQTGFYWNPIRR